MRIKPVIEALLLVLLLTSCTVSEPVNSPDKQQQEYPAQTETVSGGVALPSGNLPDSAFHIPKPPERYYRDTTLNFIPSHIYGRVYPYIGGWTYSVMGMASELYGVCDESGKIICDPVYNNVRFIENSGNTLYAFIKNEMGAGEEFYTDEYVTTLVSVDGSWAATYESVIWEESYADEWSPVPEDYFYSVLFSWRVPVIFEYITARRDGKWGVLDWDGTQLLPFDYREPVCFYEGLASVLSEDGNSVYFIDITGKTVLGPYSAPPTPVSEWSGALAQSENTAFKLMFYEGYARFYENGKFGMIDRSGKVVIPAKYDFITSFHNGTAQIVLDLLEDYDSRRCGVINSSGEVVLEPQRDVWLSSEEPAAINYPVYEDNKYIFEKTGNEFPSDKYTLDYINDELIIIADRERSVWRLYDYDGNPLTPERPGMISYYKQDGYGENYIWVGADKYGEWTWPPSYTLYDLGGNQVLDGVFKAIIPFDDKFLVRGERTAGLMDKDGNFVIEVSVLAHGID